MGTSNIIILCEKWVLGLKKMTTQSWVFESGYKSCWNLFICRLLLWLTWSGQSLTLCYYMLGYLKVVHFLSRMYLWVTRVTLHTYLYFMCLLAFEILSQICQLWEIVFSMQKMKLCSLTSTIQKLHQMCPECQNETWYPKNAKEHSKENLPSFKHR